MAYETPNLSNPISTPLPSPSVADQAGMAGLLQGIRGQQAQAENKQKAQLEGEAKHKELQEHVKTLKDLITGNVLPEGASTRVGEISVGVDPSLKLAAMQQKAGPQQANQFVKTVNNAYKPIQDQVDSSKATLDALNLGNSAGDKTALVNESRLIMGQSGGRALGAIVKLMTGDPTMETDIQKAKNWINNTPNIPTLQPAQRDAVRELVFDRLNQVKDLHGKAQQALTQQGPIVAPQADYGTLLKSVINPVQDKINELDKMRDEYKQARTKQPTSNSVSSPAVANPNPTTMDRLKSLLGGGPSTSSTGPQGPAVVQNGQVYRWNPTTRTYE